MTGCFGDSPMDRYYENQLDEYLNESEKYQCEKCGHKDLKDRFEYDSEEGRYICPECKKLTNL